MMHDDDERALQTMFQSDLRRLREAAPAPPPVWRIAQAARARAARRMARRLRWMWWAAAGLLALGAVPLLLHDPRALPGFIVPLLLGAMACWHEEPNPA